VRPEATMELREPVDLLLVTVKAPALDDALGRIEAPVETVVPLLNGIEHMDTIRRRIRTLASSAPRSGGSRPGSTGRA
jgi:Ketopantoate reductase